jgi:ectoine hydroxylase-related dioxygenase (phytanoyl-CoA dioxygenase family)
MAYQVKDKEQLLKRFDEDGFLVFRNVLDKELMREASDHVDWLLAKHPELRPEQLHHHLAVDDPFWIRLVSDDRLLDVAETFIGPNIALFATHYICKPPKTGQPVLWHQDGAYWPLEPMRVVTLWLSITDSKPDNGCLRVIRGSQHVDLQELRERHDVENVLGSEIVTEVDESDAVDIVTEPGDVEVHHPNIIHGSEANTSDRWRKGLTIRYIPTSTRITKPGFGSPFLLRGEPVPGVNEYLEQPAFDSSKHFPFRRSDT